MELVRKLLEDANDADEVRSVLLLASTFWNMTLAADERRADSGDAAAQALREDLVDHLERALERPRAACEVLVDEMARRERDLFADDLRFVMEIDNEGKPSGKRLRRQAMGRGSSRWSDCCRRYTCRCSLHTSWESPMDRSIRSRRLSCRPWCKRDS